MRPKRITLSPTATDADGISATQTLTAAGDYLINGALATGFDADGIAQSQTPAAGGVQSLTLNGALVTAGNAELDITYGGQYVTVTSAADDTARTFTATGQNTDGETITEAITGTDSTSAIGSTLFAVVTGVTTDDDTAGAITVGVNGYVDFTTAQHVTITSAGDDTGDTFTVTGQDRYTDALTESITGASGSAAVGTKNFLVVQKISISGASALGVTVGVNGTCESQWVRVPFRDFSNVSFAVDITGAATFTVQQTLDDLEASGFDESTAVAFADDSVAAATADAQGSFTDPCSAVRVDVTAFTSGNVNLTVMPGAG